MSPASTRPSKNERPRPRNAKRPFGRRLLTALPLLVGACLLTLLLDSLGGLRALETAALDVQSRLYPGPDATGVALVIIGARDYQDWFGSKSPLDPVRLQSLLENILATHPRAVAVDLLTTAPAFTSLELPAGGPPVIWAREATFSHRHHVFRLGSYLGGARPDRLSGVVAQELDTDHRIRRYQLLFSTDQGPVPSLPWAAVCAARGRSPLRGAGLSDEFFIRFTTRGVPLHFDSAAVRLMAAHPEWRQGSALTGKIVVLGSDYGDDEQETPVGWRLGSEILADTLQTELDGHHVRPLGLPALVLLQLTEGVLFLLFFHLSRLRTAVAASLFVIPALACGFSLLGYSTIGRWGSFVPILLAILGQQLYERAKKTRSEWVEKAAAELEGKSTTEPEARSKRPRTPSR